MNPETKKEDAVPFNAPRVVTRADRRRLATARYEGPAGLMSCKFCHSTKGTFIRMGNRFVCQTSGCKGNLEGGKDADRPR